MNNGLKLLLMAAGAIVTCIVVVVGFQLTKSGKSDTAKASEQYTAVMSEYEEMQLSVYEDSTVSGADVINYIKDNAMVIANNEISGMYVKTKASSTTIEFLAEDFDTAEKVKEKLNTYQQSVSSTTYINPSGTFRCNIDKNKNGIITTIKFTQQ